MQEQTMIENKGQEPVGHYQSVILKANEKINLAGIELEYINDEENTVKASLEAKRRGRFVMLVDKIEVNKCSVYNLKEGKIACIMVEEIHKDLGEDAYAKVRVDLCEAMQNRSC
jgi:hypothetical protein